MFKQYFPPTLSLKKCECRKSLRSRGTWVNYTVLGSIESLCRKFHNRIIGHFNPVYTYYPDPG